MANEPLPTPSTLAEVTPAHTATIAVELFLQDETLIKAFQMGECDWMAATDAESAVSGYLEHTGMTAADIEDDGPPVEVSLDTEMVDNLELPPDQQRRLTFREAIIEHLRAGGSVPFFLASTEY